MKPHDQADAPATLPTWTIVPLLCLLVAVGSMVVLVGWSFVKPAPPRKNPEIAEVVAEAKSTPIEEAPAVSRAEPEQVEDKPAAPRPRESFQLPRRRVSDSTDQARPAVLKDQHSPAPSPAQPKPDETPKAKPPLRWVSDSPKAGDREVNLMLPVEVAKVESGPVLYSMRRLRFPDGDPKRLRLAVTPYQYDDMASLLTQMGPGYEFTNIKNEDTYFYDKIKGHDVLFLTCAEIFPQDFQSVGALRRFVEMGGTLYASDLRADLLQSSFSDFRARSTILPGPPQQIEADVVDPGLRKYLGMTTIPLNFESPGWRPAAFDSNKVNVCLRGVYRNNLGQAYTVPLMVKFRVKRGTVVFTSFHNSRNDSAIVKKVLEYLVFASVNARSEARLKELMKQSQFTPQDLHPVAISMNKPVEAVHQHKGGGLQIALGYENLGAKLKLTLHSPSGKIVEHEEEGLFLIEIPKAEAGAWRYTVTPTALPYPNFPIVVAVGVMKS